MRVTVVILGAMTREGAISVPSGSDDTERAWSLSFSDSAGLRWVSYISQVGVGSGVRSWWRILVAAGPSVYQPQKIRHVME